MTQEAQDGSGGSRAGASCSSSEHTEPTRAPASSTPRTYLRRDVLQAALAGGGLIILGGCGGSSKGRSTNRTITIVRGSDISTLDPRKSSSATDLSIIRNITDTLIRSDRSSESKLKPFLATSWKPVGATRWRFELRKDVKFSDGTPFDAETAKWTLDQLAMSSNVNHVVANAVEGGEVVDRYTVDAITKYPSGSTPLQLQAVGNMLNPKWVTSDDYSPAKQIGTGAGELVAWKKGQDITLKVRPDYWHGKLNYAKVVFRPVSDAQSRANSAATADADIITNILPQDVERLSNVKGMQIKRTVSTRVATIRIQDNVPPFDNKLVRQALNYAVDIPSIVKNVLKGFGRPVNGQSIGSFAINWQPDLKPYPHDPEKAKALLAKAGYAGGFDTKLGTPRGKDPGDYEFVQAAAGQLKQVGINAEVVVHEPGEYLAMYSGTQPADPLLYWSSGNFIPSFENTLVDYLTPTSFNVRSPYVKKSFEQLVRTVDPKERAKLSREVSIYLRDYAPEIFGFQIEAAFAVSDRIDWAPRQYIDWIYMDEIRLKKA